MVKVDAVGMVMAVEMVGRSELSLEWRQQLRQLRQLQRWWSRVLVTVAGAMLITHQSTGTNWTKFREVKLRESRKLAYGSGIW